jgi:hypothetical protein
MEYTGIIYRAYCVINRKSYIGQTRQDFLIRKRSHINESFNENVPQYNYHFHRAIRKHGISNFEWSILETITASTLEALSECLNSLEIKYIKLYDSFYNGYNSTTGGEQCNKKCKKVTIYNIEGDVVKRLNNCSEAAQYLNIKESKVRDIVLKRSLFHYDNGIKYIIRYSDYNLTKSELEYIETLEPLRFVYMFDHNGRLVNGFESVTEGSKLLGISNRQITDCCNKSRKCTTIDNKIYTFRYSGESLSDMDIEYLKSREPSGFKLKAINSKTMEVIGIYNSFDEASKSLNINRSSICQCCKGKRKTGGKINGIPVIWEYTYEN